MTEQHDKALVKIYSAASPEEAALFTSLLQSHGIQSVVQGCSLWGARGEIPFGPGTAPSVWVHEANAQRARDLVSELENKPPPNAPPWECPKCGEELAGQFTQCWHCGADRPNSEGDE